MPTDEDLDIYDKILRLHVIANSDSDTDQSLKLAVRDTVLKNLGEKLDGCADRFEAETIAENKKEEELCAAAEETLRQGGSDDDVRIEIGKEYYPTRIYEGVRLPAGTYNSLRVIIGNGADITGGVFFFRFCVQVRRLSQMKNLPTPDLRRDR